MTHNVHRASLSIVFALALMALSTPAWGQPSATDITVNGIAFNANANATTGFALEITGGLGGTYTAIGSFDNVNLFGRFRASGASLNCHEPGQCFQFQGEFTVGGEDGSGFPEGTATSFVLTLAFNGVQVTGVYHIGPLPRISGEQYGIIEGYVTD